MKLHLSPKQLARAIRVSESSVKRWCDQGVIATVRTAGGHRRIAIGDVMEFLRQHDHPVVTPEELGLPANCGGSYRVTERAADPFREALLDGDENRARCILFELYLAGQKLPEILDGVVTKTFQAVGEAWRCGKLEVYQERRACELCLRLLHELRHAAPAPQSAIGLALGGTPEGDVYQLPSTMVDLVLRHQGWVTQNLGTGLPFATLAAAIEHCRPDLFWLSVSHVQDEKSLIEGCIRLAEACQPDARFLIGGRAITPTLARRVPFAAFCPDMRNLVKMLNEPREGLGCAHRKTSEELKGTST